MNCDALEKYDVSDAQTVANCVLIVCACFIPVLFIPELSIVVCSIMLSISLINEYLYAPKF